MSGVLGGYFPILYFSFSVLYDSFEKKIHRVIKLGWAKLGNFCSKFVRIQVDG